MADAETAFKPSAQYGNVSGADSIEWQRGIRQDDARAFSQSWIIRIRPS